MRPSTYVFLLLINKLGITCEFLISLCIWYTVLQEVNIVSKSIQGPSNSLETYASLLSGSY